MENTVDRRTMILVVRLASQMYRTAGYSTLKWPGKATCFDMSLEMSLEGGLPREKLPANEADRLLEKSWYVTVHGGIQSLGLVFHSWLSVANADLVTAA